MTRCLFLIPLCLFGCSRGEGDGPDGVGAVEYYCEVGDNAVKIPGANVLPGTSLLVTFFECDEDLCAAAYVDGTIETTWGDIEGESVVEDVFVDGDTLEGVLEYDDMLFALSGERIGNGAVLDVQMHYLIFEVADFSLDRISEEELNVEDL